MSGSTKRKETSGDVKDMGFFSYWYYRYLLSSALYMLEPWERNLFHTIVFLVVGMMVYSAYIYIPYHSVTVYNIILDVAHRLLNSDAGS